MIKQLFIEEKMDEHLRVLNLPRGRFIQVRLVMGGGLGLLALMAGMVLDKAIFYLLAPFIFYGGYKYPYYNLYINRMHVEGMKAFAFPVFLRTFLTLLSSQSNIYQTFVETERNIDEPLKSRLRDFVKLIEKDNDYKHYVEFADYIGTTEAHMVMSMLHNFSEVGIRKEELKELEALIDNIHANKMEEMIKRKADEQEKYTNPTMLLAIGFVMLFAGVLLVDNISALLDAMTFGTSGGGAESMEEAAKEVKAK